MPGFERLDDRRMNSAAPHTLPSLRAYVTAPYPCAYLPERQARALVALPDTHWTTQLYTPLVERGFRRSGMHVYRPRCDACNACVSLRIAVAEFAPNRSQRRACQAHQNLVCREAPRAFNPDHFALYCAYQRARHPGSGMDTRDPQQYCEYMIDSPVDTALFEFCEGTVLRMVAVVDRLSDGWSAVYTFYDPTPGLSLGTFGIQWQIAQLRRMGLPYLYLGYWIADDPKMAYKNKFYPHQRRIDGSWVTFSGKG